MQTKTRQATNVQLSGLIKASLVSGITAVFAYITIPLPFSPVPITLQSLGIMIAGLILGPTLGACSVFLYLTLGFIGIPVFAGGSAGVAPLVGATGGYILGFLPGAWVTGTLSQLGLKCLKPNATSSKRFILYLISCVVGSIVVVHIFGMLHLAKSVDITFSQAAAIGTIPFLPGDFVKAIIASVLACKIRKMPFSLP